MGNQVLSRLQAVSRHRTLAAGAALALIAALVAGLLFLGRPASSPNPTGSPIAATSTSSPSAAPTTGRPSATPTATPTAAPTDQAQATIRAEGWPVWSPEGYGPDVGNWPNGNVLIDDLVLDPSGHPLSGWRWPDGELAYPDIVGPDGTGYGETTVQYNPGSTSIEDVWAFGPDGKLVYDTRLDMPDTAPFIDLGPRGSLYVTDRTLGDGRSGSKTTILDAHGAVLSSWTWPAAVTSDLPLILRDGTMLVDATGVLLSHGSS